MQFPNNTHKHSHTNLKFFEIGFCSFFESYTYNKNIFIANMIIKTIQLL